MTDHGRVTALMLTPMVLVLAACSAPSAEVAAATTRCPVALTFDDGPTDATVEVLEILAASEARATFFFVGVNVVDRPDVARRAVEEGHEAGAHTWSHVDLTTVPQQQAATEITKSRDVLTRATGTRPTLGRAPLGASNDALFQLWRDEGMELIYWAPSTPGDWEGADATTMHRHVLDTIRCGDIILLHGAEAGTRRMLPGLIDDLRADGFEPGRIVVTDVYVQRNGSAARAGDWPET